MVLIIAVGALVTPRDSEVAMAYAEEEKLRIFSKTEGKCRHCAKQLAYENYGKNGARGSWHIDHSLAKANGGSDDFANLWASCIKCNLAKSDCNVRVFRNLMKPERIQRRRDAIVYQLRGEAIPLSLLGTGVLLALDRAIDNFRGAKEAEAVDESKAEELRATAWFSLAVSALCFVIMAVIVVAIFRSKRSP
jgi:hypothetical protein